MSNSYLRPQKSANGSQVDLINCASHAVETDMLTNRIHQLFRQQVLGPAFPCALGKGAAARLHYRFGAYADMNDPVSAKAIWHDLCLFVSEQPTITTRPDHYSTFIVFFKNTMPLDEQHYEDFLWTLLRNVHSEDSMSFSWDPKTSKDPNDPNFSFSVSQQSFFVVGLHKASSRISRKFPYAGMAFNAHHQFEHLRATNKFTFFQNVIRANDTKIQGSINPSLTNYGSDSEAKQYSGRLVPPGWRCPFP